MTTWTSPCEDGRVSTPILDLLRPAVYLLCRAYFGLSLVGVENIPARGPLIITPNHQTYADPPFVTIPVRRRVHYMAWGRLFGRPLSSWVLRRLRAFPVTIEGADPRAVRAAARLLGAGEALMIFPEGGRSLDGQLAGFKPGAFRLAVAHDAMILPVTITGGTDSWPPGRAFPRRGRITITYHPVLRVDRELDPRLAARQLADRARTAIESAL